MADVLGVVATKVAAGGLTNAALSGLIDARVKAMVDTYVILGTEASGSTITLGGILPKGANVLEIILTVTANQTTATFSVGDAESATRYASAATDLQTAGRYVYAGNNYVCDDTSPTSTDRQIVLTTGGATLSAATLYATILYTLD